MLADLGYTLQPAQPYSWKIFHSSQSEQIKNDFYTHRYPFCDVFVMRELKGRFVLKDKTGRNAWPEEFYTKEQVIQDPFFVLSINFVLDRKHKRARVRRLLSVLSRVARDVPRQNVRSLLV